MIFLIFRVFLANEQCVPLKNKKKLSYRSYKFSQIVEKIEEVNRFNVEYKSTNFYISLLLR